MLIDSDNGYPNFYTRTRLPKRTILVYIIYIIIIMKTTIKLHILWKTNRFKLDIYLFLKIAHLFLIYPINPTQINPLFSSLVRFGLYRINVQIQSKPIHIFLIGLDIEFSRNRTKLSP